jgi:cytochrome c oxidase subunit 2
MVTGFLLLTGCSAEQQGEIKRLAMPEAITKEAPHIHDLWMGSWIAAGLTGLVVWSLIFFVAIRYRRRSDDEIPIQTRYNLPIEIFYTIAPIMMVIVFFYFTVDTQNKVLHDDKNPDETITVVGQQWSWTFNYTKGNSDIENQPVWEAGTTADRPTLYLVEGQSVSVDLYSPDVIHSFWVPNFLYKMDVVPGREKYNHFTFTPNREGTFDGRCAELCGVYHSRMLFNVEVTDQATFDSHMARLKAEGNTGVNLGGEMVRDVPGLGDHSNGGEE